MGARKAVSAELSLYSGISCAYCCGNIRTGYREHKFLIFLHSLVEWWPEKNSFIRNGDCMLGNRSSSASIMHMRTYVKVCKVGVLFG